MIHRNPLVPPDHTLGLELPDQLAAIGRCEVLERPQVDILGDEPHRSIQQQEVGSPAVGAAELVRSLADAQAGAPLFANINPDFAWNSPQNQSPFSQQIDTYLNPGGSSYPDGAVSHHAGNSHLFQFNKGISIAEITDGTSNTILAGNVSTGFKLWGDPTNVRDPGLGIGNTPEQFGGPFQGGAHFLMADGRVRFVYEKTDRNVLKALATPAGGEQVGEF